ncbi:hypothetical protein BX666DRAFT_1457951 [Dichotomocladium elegans]|nr:hypothetical protein BX666DRAFT_1457951 [Dichotomocladium elegans]
MEETDAKRTKITDVLDFIQERLAELEQEKEELSQFQTLDRQRRSIEYTIYTREQAEVNEKLEELEANRRRDLASIETKRQEYIDNESNINSLSETQSKRSHCWKMRRVSFLRSMRK